MATPVRDLLARYTRLRQNRAVNLAVDYAADVLERRNDGVPLGEAAREELRERVGRRLAEDDGATNAANAENPVKSRINIGNVTGFLGWLSTVVLIVGYATGQNALPEGFDFVAFMGDSGAWMTALLAIGGNVLTFIGRNVRGFALAKLFKPKTWFRRVDPNPPVMDVP